jgi:hypothetical protein
VINSFVAYPTQSLIGSTILGAAAMSFYLVRRPHSSGSRA